MTSSPKNIFSYTKSANSCRHAPVLPMSKKEMKKLGWKSCDIIIITGDAYVDHPSFGMALIGRLLEKQGFRVGIISQPNWHSKEAFQALGKPNLFFGVTAGNMDSMVNRYTSEHKPRSNDAYTPNGEPNKRPDRAVIVYTQRCREAYPKIPVMIGGIEASMRRIAHYDYWSDKIRRSILLDSKANILLYGNAERAIVELSHRLANGENITNIRDIRGTAVMVKSNSKEHIPKTAIRLPSFEQVRKSPHLSAKATRLLYLESNPCYAHPLLQNYNDRDLLINPPPIPLSTKELDGVYELPYSRSPHPSYANNKIPAYEMIRFSITIMRGCFGGCSFCSITAHEGKIIQNRSEESILKEIKKIRDKTPGFTGVISDLGGPTANMYKLKCKNTQCNHACHKLSCLYPKTCRNMETDHTPLITLYRKARKTPGIKKVLIASGVRYDLAIKSPQYIEELVKHHVGGYLKIAPEHVAKNPLSKMMKTSIDSFQHFKKLFNLCSCNANKKQYLIPYFIAAHPGTSDEDMLELALWLKANNFRLDQVQTFLPTPMTLATAMYHTSLNPIDSLEKKAETVTVPKGGKKRRLHKAFIRYHDKKNWPLLRKALISMGKQNLIGYGKNCLVPPR